jgi:hypothetical protein
MLVIEEKVPALSDHPVAGLDRGAEEVLDAAEAGRHGYGFLSLFHGTTIASDALFSRRRNPGDRVRNFREHPRRLP